MSTRVAASAGWHHCPAHTSSRPVHDASARETSAGVVPLVGGGGESHVLVYENPTHRLLRVHGVGRGAAHQIARRAGTDPGMPSGSPRPPALSPHLAPPRESCLPPYTRSRPRSCGPRPGKQPPTLRWQGGPERSMGVARLAPHSAVRPAAALRQGQCRCLELLALSRGSTRWHTAGGTGAEAEMRILRSPRRAKDLSPTGTAPHSCLTH